MNKKRYVEVEKLKAAIEKKIDGKYSMFHPQDSIDLSESEIENVIDTLAVEREPVETDAIEHEPVELVKAREVYHRYRYELYHSDIKQSLMLALANYIIALEKQLEALKARMK